MAGELIEALGAGEPPWRPGDRIGQQPLVRLLPTAERSLEIDLHVDALAVELFDAASSAGRTRDVDHRCLTTVLDHCPVSTRLSVNLRPETLVLSGPRLLDEIADRLERRSLRPDQVILELREAPGDLDELVVAVERARRRGFAMAVDDLTTGFSGLARVVRLRPDVVKLDGGLVSGCDLDLARGLMVEKLTEISHGLGATVVAEHVETEGELAVVRAAGCDLVQGWLAAPAMSTNDLHSWRGSAMLHP